MDLKKEAGLENAALPETIRPMVKASISARDGLQSLTSLVPTRFLSPWFATELRGVDGHVRTRRIQELAAQSQLSSNPSPYFFERVGSDTIIHVNESWTAFFHENFEVIRSFVFFHLCRYLQARNPNVPGIVNKLTAPLMRDLGPARTYWRAVRSEFNRMGEGPLFHDIYSGEPLDNLFSVDHFLPWSFVAHDLIWNLTPVTAMTNSKKSDFLPKLELYLPKLSRLHRESLCAMKEKPKLLEDYANLLRADINGIISMPDDRFHKRYRDSIEPQLQIAQNQGFQGNWSWL